MLYRVVVMQVFVSPDLALEDSLIRSIDYNTQAEMSSTVSVEGPGLQLFSHLRDAVVNAARAEGKVPAGVPHSEYLLRVSTFGLDFKCATRYYCYPPQISSSVTLIPASDLPLSWLPAYVAETNFKIQITEGVLEVDLVKRRDQFLIEVPIHLFHVSLVSLFTLFVCTYSPQTRTARVKRLLLRSKIELLALRRSRYVCLNT